MNRPTTEQQNHNSDSPGGFLNHSSLTSLIVEISRAFVRGASLREMLQDCAEALVKNLHAAFARVWTLDAAENVLVLRASAGMYTHLDGPHSRVPLGQYKIGLIAQERQPHLTNAVVGDSRVSDQEWAKREGMVAFAGYPLVVDSELVGVMALFARHSLNEATLRAMAAVANSIALGIRQRQAALALHDSEARYRLIAENIREVFWLTDPATSQVVYISPAYEEVWGRSRDHLYREPRSFLEAIHPDDRGRVERELDRQSREGCFEVEYRVVRPDGTVRWVLDRGLAVQDTSGVPQVAGVALDITNRKRAEVRLLVQHAATHMLAEAENLDGAIRQLLPTLGANLGWDAGHFWLVDREAGVLRCLATWHTGGIGAAVFEEAALSWTFGLGTGLPGRVWASSDPTWVLDVSRDDNFARKEAASAAGLHTGLGFPVRFGEEVFGVFEFFSRYSEQPDAELLAVLRAIGSQVGQFVVRKRGEERLHQAEEQYRHAQKMEAFGQLAGGIAHDFNNLMTVVNGFAEIVLGSLAAEHPQRGMLQEIKRAGERATSLTQQLLAFSRKQILQMKVLDLNVVVRDVEKMLRRTLGEDVELAVSLAPDLGRVKADPSQVSQVILNLAVNARDAMPQGGNITIETRNAELDEAHAPREWEVEPGPCVLLTVSDTGCGMDEATKARVFEPFFTTKEVGQGSGLGLATVYGIVKQSEGHIEVESQVGTGSMFKVYLPRVVDVRSGDFHPGLLTAPRGNETVLLVEDEDAVRGFTGMALRSSGYTVLVAKDGEDALRVAESHYGPVHLLVTDVVMPRMGGPVLAERLRASHPLARVLFVSGYTDDTVLRHGVLHSEANLIHKPFSPAALAKKVREVLDASPL